VRQPPAGGWPAAGSAGPAMPRTPRPGPSRHRSGIAAAIGDLGCAWPAPQGCSFCQRFDRSWGALSFLPFPRFALSRGQGTEKHDGRCWAGQVPAVQVWRCSELSGGSLPVPDPESRLPWKGLAAALLPSPRLLGQKFDQANHHLALCPTDLEHASPTGAGRRVGDGGQPSSTACRRGCSAR
jgi:hypothetical protein